MFATFYYFVKEWEIIDPNFKSVPNTNFLKFFKKTDVCFEITDKTFNNRLSELRNGEIKITTTTKTEEQKQKVKEAIEKYIHNQSVVKH